jgi:ribosomal protein S18 acetylase RimI-like enzyme
MTEIRAIQTIDYAAWLPLWNGNNLGIQNQDITDTTWARLTDPDFPVHGLMAFENGMAVGLLHYVTHPTTGSLQDICYMQDVYVDPLFRRRGIARSLVTELARIGQTETSWARLYWLADASNVAAQGLYKSLGVKLDFTLHVMPMG